MNISDVMTELKGRGCQQTRSAYVRYGIEGAHAFGVPDEDLRDLTEKIGVDQRLAEELWATGNHDARMLAALVADPASMRSAAIETWVKTATNQLVLDAIALLVAKTGFARRTMIRWMGSKNEWIAAAGWRLLSTLLVHGGPDSHFADHDLLHALGVIEREIHQAPHRVRYAMNEALTAIGARRGSLAECATAAVKNIGKVEILVDRPRRTIPEVEISGVTAPIPMSPKGEAKGSALKVSSPATRRRAGTLRTSPDAEIRNGSAKKAPAKKAPAKKSPAKKAPAKKTPSNKTSARERR